MYGDMESQFERCTMENRTRARWCKPYIHSVAKITENILSYIVLKPKLAGIQFKIEAYFSGSRWHMHFQHRPEIYRHFLMERTEGWNECETKGKISLSLQLNCRNRSTYSANRQRTKTHATVYYILCFVLCFALLCSALCVHLPSPNHSGWFWPNVNGARIINWLCLRLPFTVSYQLMIFVSTRPYHTHSLSLSAHT